MSKLDALRRQCRTLESLLDTKLSSYARLASAASTSNYSDLGSTRWDDIENEVEGLLEKVCNVAGVSPLVVILTALNSQLRDTNNEMTSILDDPDAPPSQSTLHAVQRHRDILQDYLRDFAQTRVRPSFLPTMFILLC